MAPPEDQVIAIDQLLKIKTDEVMWSLYADTLRSIKEALEFTDADGFTDLQGAQVGAKGFSPPLGRAMEEFRTAFRDARNQVADALESAVRLSRGLEYGLAEAYRRFGNAEAQAVAAVMSIEQTEQWKKEATTTLLPGHGPLSLTFERDWREEMDEDGGYRR